MKETDTYSGLEAILIGIIQEVLVEIGNKVNRHMQAMINKDVYRAHTPNQYERTYQLRDSVTTSSVKAEKGGGSVEIFHDRSKIKYNPSKFQHGSPPETAGGGDISEWIPEIISFNWSGDLFGFDKWWHHRDNYFYDTLNDLKQKGLLSRWFKEELRKRGVEVE